MIGMLRFRSKSVREPTETVASVADGRMTFSLTTTALLSPTWLCRCCHVVVVSPNPSVSPQSWLQNEVALIPLSMSFLAWLSHIAIEEFEFFLCLAQPADVATDAAAQRKPRMSDQPDQPVVPAAYRRVRRKPVDEEKTE